MIDIVLAIFTPLAVMRILGLTTTRVIMGTDGISVEVAQDVRAMIVILLIILPILLLLIASIVKIVIREIIIKDSIDYFYKKKNEQEQIKQKSQRENHIDSENPKQ